MNKTAIRNYAIRARIQLIESAKQRAYQYEITENGENKANVDAIGGRLLSPEEKQQRARLIEEINQKGYTQVMEEAAYTWFNRFIALRFMEVNGYLPSKVRVFTDENGAFKPEILKEAMRVELEGLDRNKVLNFLDKQDNEALYKYLLITQCNALNSCLPTMFEKISNWTELLFPDNLLREGSVVEQLVSQILEEDWKDAVQIIGWLYQYYNIEPKDKVFEDLKKNIKITKDKIPAATQLFTPDWIVRYMVENSLGKLWIEGHPNSHIKDEWKYYLDEAEQEDGVKAKLAVIREQYAKIEPKQIKCIDPCMGSGHILVYMFDVLVQIYNEYGYSSRDAASMIVENNLFGLDIDDRAAQLAYFAVMMRGCKYDRRFLERGVQPHVYSVPESNHIPQSILRYFAVDDAELRLEVYKLVETFRDAKEYGSLLQISQINFSLIYEKFDKLSNDGDILQNKIIQSLLPLCRVAEVLAQKYDVVITNPPYMGSSGMDAKLSDFVKRKFPDSKADLFAVFIEACGTLLKRNGLQAMITQHAWMFLSSFEKLRRKIIDTREIESMVHLGAHAFEEIGGEVVQTISFVLRKAVLGGNGIYFRLVNSVNKEQDFVDSIHAGGGVRFVANAAKFNLIPGSPIAYWITNALLQVFTVGKRLDEIADIKQGLATADNNRFVRLWYEVSTEKSYYEATDYINAFATGMKWFPYNKGGEFRRWYGNNDCVVNWYENGKEIVSFKNSVVRNPQYYFRSSLTWSKIGSGKISFRYKPKGHIFDVAGTSIFVDDNVQQILLEGLLNTKVIQSILDFMSPTLNYEVGQIANIPVILPEESKGVHAIAEHNISISKFDWDSYETSWDFKKHPLI